MTPLSTLLQQRDIVKKPRSARASIISMIADKLKEERGKKTYYLVGTTKKTLSPITDKLVAIRTAHLKSLTDLYYLYSTCKNSLSFSKAFWFHTKTTVAA